jgi:hypothetical protein
VVVLSSDRLPILAEDNGVVSLATGIGGWFGHLLPEGKASLINAPASVSGEAKHQLSCSLLLSEHEKLR